MAKAKMTEIPVVVTTAHKGVFFGYIPSDTDTTQSAIRLTQAQMAVYWSADVHGVLGLAACGPKRGCKIGLPVPAITLRDVTAVMEATPEAAKAWTERPWS